MIRCGLEIEERWNLTFLFQAIRGFRETEKSRWSLTNEIVISRIRETTFVDEPSSPLTHVLDLAKDG